MKPMSTAFILCLGLALLPSAYAQGGAQTQPADPTAQSPTTPAQTTPPTFPEPAPKVEGTEGTERGNSASATAESGTMFTGSIVHQKSGYVLKTGSTTYKLDDQAQAKANKGKNVKVTGSLDKDNHTIHVEKIEPSSAM